MFYRIHELDKKIKSKIDQVSQLKFAIKNTHLENLSLNKHMLNLIDSKWFLNINDKSLKEHIQKKRKFGSISHHNCVKFR